MALYNNYTLIIPSIYRGAEKRRYPADKSYDILIKELQTLPRDQMSQTAAPGGWTCENMVVDDAFKIINSQKVDPADTAKSVDEYLKKELKNQLEKAGK